MECSICMATHNKAAWLERTLESVACQSPPFDFEVIVVDDNSTDGTQDVCDCFSSHITYRRMEHERPYGNPAIPRNEAYKMARGRVIICQSDEVVHTKPGTIEKLVTTLQPDTFTIATVLNTDTQGNIVQKPIPVLTGLKCKRPFFFLGALLRRDLYKAGGNDELYVAPSREDDAFAQSLTNGLGLTARYAPDIVGHHIDHPRPRDLRQLCQPSIARWKLRQKLCASGRESWLSPGAPWPYVENQPHPET